MCNKLYHQFLIGIWIPNNYNNVRVTTRRNFQDWPRSYRFLWRDGTGGTSATLSYSSIRTPVHFCLAKHHEIHKSPSIARSICSSIGGESNIHLAESQNCSKQKASRPCHTFFSSSVSLGARIWKTAKNGEKELYSWSVWHTSRFSEADNACGPQVHETRKITRQWGLESPQKYRFF